MSINRQSCDPVRDGLLNDPNREIRIRVILVLAYMNLLSADAVLEEQISNEPDKDVCKFIDSELAKHRPTANSN